MGSYHVLVKRLTLWDRRSRPDSFAATPVLRYIFSPLLRTWALDRSSIHCLTCGGYVAKPARARYRVWSEHAHVAPVIDQACLCLEPVLIMLHRANRRRQRAAKPNGTDD